MALKPGKDIDELCYPFIYEGSWLCDYEVATDELCSHIGMVLALLPEAFDDMRSDLERLQPLAFHINGSIRGRLAVDEQEIDWLHACLDRYREEIRGRLSGFVLPRGPQPVPQLNLARSAAKKAIRIMVRLDQEGIAVPDILHRMCNLICNLLFTLTLVLNQRRGVDEIPFHSRSYGPR